MTRAVRSAERVWDVIDGSDLAESERAARFLQSTFGETGADPIWDGAVMRWKLGPDNPAGPGILMLGEHEGRVVGVVSLVPKRLWIEGRKVIGAEIGDAYTDLGFHKRVVCSRPYEGVAPDPAYVEKSVFGRLAVETLERAFARGLDVIYGTPNAKALPGWTKRLGFFVPETPLYRNHLRPSASLLADREPRLRPLLPVLHLAIPTGLAVARLAGGLGLGSYRLDTSVPDPAELDALWARRRERLRFSLVKDAAWLRWRFLEAPIAGYAIYALRAKNGTLAGWAVLRRFRGPGAAPFLYVADWLIDAPAKVGAAFLDAALRAGGPGDARVLIWAPDSEPTVAALRSAWLFFPRQEGVVMFHEKVRAQLPELASAASDFTMASSDNV